MKILIKLLLYLLLPVAVLFFLFRTGLLPGIAGLAAYLLVLVYLLRPYLYQYLGSAEYSKGNLEKALDWFSKACGGKRAKPATLTSYGYILLKTGKIAEAEEVLNRVLSMELTTDQKMYARSNLALVLWKKGRLDEAVEMLEEVIKEYRNTTVYGSLGYLLILKGDLQRALEFNREAMEYNGSNPVIMDNMGQTYLLLGEFDKAAEIYESLMEKKPSFPEAYYNFGLLLEKRGDAEKALEMFRKAFEYKLSFISTITSGDIEEKIRRLEANPPE